MQKKILLAVIICTIVTTVTAQIKKGAVLLGGGIGFSTQTTNTNANTGYTNSSISISPVFGKAIKENLVLGFDLTYGHSVNKSNFPATQKSNSYGAGVFVRKYKVLGKGFYLFGQGRLGFAYTDFKNDYSPPGLTMKVYNFGTSFYPGISYAVSNKIQLEAGLNDLLTIGYSHQDLTGSGKSNSFSINSSLSNPTNFTVGIRFLLN